MPFLAKDNRPLSAKMIRNVAFGGLRTMLVAPIPFLMTPLILSKTGPRGYGTWAVFVSMNSLTTLADFGLVGTVSKYVAEYYARRNFVQLNKLLNTGFAVFMGIASLCASVLWAVSTYIVPWIFRGSGMNVNDLVHLFRSALLLLWINIVTFLSASVTAGLQRLDLSNMATAFNILGAAGAGTILLFLGWGVKGLLYANIASAFLTFLLYTWLIHRILPEFVLNLSDVDQGEAKKIFGFSLQIYINQAAVAIFTQIEKLFLALLVGVVAVGWYDIASDVALKIRGACGLVLSPVLPAASELDARGQHDKLDELYYRSHKYLALTAVPVVSFAVVVSRRFLVLWIGPAFDFIALPLTVLLIVNFINLTTAPGYFIFAGQGFLRPGIYSALVAMGLNVPLSFVLIYYLRFAGAVLGASISLIIGSVLFIYLFHRVTHSSFYRLMREAYLLPVLSSVVLLLVIFQLVPTRDLSWFGLIRAGILFFVSYLTCLLFTKFFDESDWNRIESVAPVIKLAKRFGTVG